MNLCVIPARGGSKRIPRKNIRDFCGKPIIAWSIEAAIKSKCFDRIIVSTDDEEIADIALQYGAEVPFRRSSKSADDYAPIIEVITETLDILKQQNGMDPTYICCIFATAPFVTAERISAAYDSMIVNGKDGIFPVVEFSYPIQRSLEMKSDNTIGMVWPEYLLSRSQDLPARYHDSGQYYWARTESLLKENTLFMTNCIAEHISPLQSQDIDVEDDWVIAELKYKALQCC